MEKISNCHGNEFVIEMLTLHSHKSSSVAEQGLRAVANLSIDHKSFFGDLGVCNIVINLLKLHLTDNSTYNENLSIQISITIFNLTSKESKNKERFIQLHAVNELMALLQNRNLTTHARKEIKEAINNIRYH